MPSARGTLPWSPAASLPELLAPPVVAAVGDVPDALVAPIDATLADTAIGQMWVDRGNLPAYVTAGTAVPELPNGSRVVTVAGNGLSEGVLTELERALHDHELVKVKLAVPDREERKQLRAQMCALLKAQLVQEIGKVVLVYRRNPEPNPKLTNLRRA